MIPKTNNKLSTSIVVETLPSRTYEVNLTEETITNMCDKLDAMKQLIYKIINTERYKHLIYSWNFGIELADLFGEPPSYIYPEIQRRIEEALTQDERIQRVDAFNFTMISKGIVCVSFTVQTVFGEVKAEKKVGIG